MFLFRGQRIDNKEWVEGYYVKCRGFHYILPPYNDNGFDERWVEEDSGGWFAVSPESLSISTGQLDKNKKEIFGSFEIDGKMSRGGDRVECADWESDAHAYNTWERDVYWDNESGMFLGLDGEVNTIIGKQLDVPERE
jgi:hypothetical protein